MFVIDRNICACCHNCASDCPEQAIDFVGTKYQIDQEKCVQCGLCAKICHTCACHEVPETPAVVTQHDPITLDCDVVVVGSGSGFVTAVSNNLPNGVALSGEEAEAYSHIFPDVTTYASEEIMKFLMGQSELTEETFAAFQDNVRSMGGDQMEDIYQGAYNRYLNKLGA